MKRILLTTYPSAYLYHGGGEREIFLLRDALNQAGVIADFYGPASRPISEYDTVIHFSLTGGVDQMLDEMARDGRQMILWPNLWFVNEPTGDDISKLQAQIDRFDAIVFKSNSEKKHFESHFNTREKEVILVRPGIAKDFSNAKRNHLFSDVYGVEDYIFWPGIIEPQKNQLTAVNALRDLEVPVVICGSIRDLAYFEECQKNSSKNFLFVPEMPFGSDIYVSALTGSKLFLELPLDFPGVSAIEAAQVGCKLILSDCTWSREYFPGRAALVDPKNVKAIRALVSDQLLESSVSSGSFTTDEFLIPNAYKNLLAYLR